MEMNCDGATPDAVSSSLISSSMTDLPQRRIPVITLISSEPINGRMRLMYISRLIMGFAASFFMDGTSVPHLQLKYNEKFKNCKI